MNNHQVITVPPLPDMETAKFLATCIVGFIMMPPKYKATFGVGVLFTLTLNEYLKE